MLVVLGVDVYMRSIVILDRLEKLCCDCSAQIEPYFT